MNSLIGRISCMVSQTTEWKIPFFNLPVPTTGFPKIVLCFQDPEAKASSNVFSTGDPEL